QLPNPSTPQPQNKYTEQQVNLNQLLAEVQANATKEEALEIVPLTNEKAAEVWAALVEQCKHDSLKSVLKAAELRVEEEELKILVGSAFGESMIREEQNQIMEFLTQAFGRQSLTLRIAKDPAKVVQAPKRKKPMTDREKFLKMAESNRLVLDVQKRFDLRPDTD
ncbi:MAG: hypothetical protein AAF798_13980, partial [Bacteroidota bacterium]